jgi:hypothetical protein
MPHVRAIGSDDNGHDVVLRFGDRLDVVPAPRPHGWVVADFTPEVLRLQGTADAASSHTFIAFAVGAGHITLTAAGPDPSSSSTFTVAIHVLRDTVQTAQP